MIRNSQTQGTLSDAEFCNHILTMQPPSRISIQKKLRDRCSVYALGFRKCKGFRRVTEEGIPNPVDYPLYQGG
jgi:hypothetical protein